MITKTTTRQTVALAIITSGLVMSLIGVRTDFELVGMIGLIIVVLSVLAAGRLSENHQWREV